MQEHGTAAADAPTKPDGVNIVRPMPRRKVTDAVVTANVTLPMARHVFFKAGKIRPLLRLLVWLGGAIRFYSGGMIDLLLGRDTVQRRAVRLRRVFETSGASFVKLGQQLSLRADILPYAYWRNWARCSTGCRLSRRRWQSRSSSAISASRCTRSLRSSPRTDRLRLAGVRLSSQIEGRPTRGGEGTPTRHRASHCRRPARTGLDAGSGRDAHDRPARPDQTLSAGRADNSVQRAELSR